MKSSRLGRFVLTLTFCSAGTFALCLGLFAHEDSDHSPELSALMKTQGRAFSKIQTGIDKQKWKGLKGWAQEIVDSADLISREYGPPIKREQTEEFKFLARELKNRAIALRQGMANQDFLEAKSLLDTMEDTCIACHKVFIPKKK